MKNHKNLWLALTLAAAVCENAGVARAAYDDVGVGARVTGLGSAFTAVADDVYAVYYNPAGLGTLDRPMLATTYSRLHMGLSDDSSLQNSFVGYSHPVANGRHGSWGAAWNRFSLDSLYTENSLFASYGRRLFAEQFPHGFYAGASLKLLSRSLGNTDVADNAVSNTGQRLNTADPVLQNASKTNMDVDLGFLYRIRPRLTAGLAVQHLMEPNIAFASNDSDKLGRNMKLGLAWQTAWTSVSGEFDMLKAPDGSTDKVGTLAFEKWLPTLMYGSFGLRASLGAGSREYRQMSAGLSYRIHRLQLDYGFNIPLGGLQGTMGSHRMGLTYRFGTARGAEPQLAEAILENLRELADVGSPEFRAQSEELALYKRTAQQEFLRQARVDTGEGRFGEAKEKLNQALGLNPKDQRIQQSLERMGIAADVFPALPAFRTDPAQAALYEGVMDFLAGRDKDAVRKLTYAASLQPADERYERLLQAAERKAGLTRELPVATGVTAPTLGREKAVGASLALMEVALRESDYPKVVKLADEVLELDAQNVLAFKRKATALYAQKNYEEALRNLRSAMKFERDGDERKRLKSYVDAMVALIERKARDKDEASVRPLPMKPEEPAKGGASPQEIQRLYEAGVDLYAQSRLSEAANMFQRILTLDPKNASAQRALRRVQAEILQGGQQ